MTPQEGIGVYVFINDHVERSIGNIINTASMPYMPYYERDNGELVRKGSFQTGRPWTTKLYQGLYKSNSISRLNLSNAWPILNAEHFQFTCDLIIESKKEFLKQFPTSRFVVLFHPLHSGYADQIAPCLAANNIEYFDLRSDWSYTDDLKVPYDGHPTAKANQMIAERLVKSLGLAYDNEQKYEK